MAQRKLKQRTNPVFSLLLGNAILFENVWKDVTLQFGSDKTRPHSLVDVPVDFTGFRQKKMK